ncbi:MAG: ABC transporter permease [Marmoricola sp.]
MTAPILANQDTNQDANQDETATRATTARDGRTAGLPAVLRWELRKLTAQIRSRAVLLGALLGPIPVVMIIHAQSQPPKDTLFGRYATTNGFSLALLLLGFAAQWVLPLLAAIVAGDIFASEDQHGTWKTVLTRSASRGRVFWAKVITACLFTVVMLVLLSASTITAALVVGGHQPLTGVSGQLISSHEALKLVAAAWATTLAPTLGFTCLAILLSVATRNPAAGIAAPAVLGMVMQLLGNLGSIAGLRTVLLSTPYEAWHGLMAAPRFTGPLVDGLIVSAVWCVVCLAAAFVQVRRRDITGG